MVEAYAKMGKERRSELKKILSMFKEVDKDDITILKPLVILKNNLRINV